MGVGTCARTEMENGKGADRGEEKWGRFEDVGSLRQEDLDSQVSLGYVKLCLRRPEGGGAFEESSLFPLPVSHIQL